MRWVYQAIIASAMVLSVSEASKADSPVIAVVSQDLDIGAQMLRGAEAALKDLRSNGKLGSIDPKLKSSIGLGDNEALVLQSAQDLTTSGDLSLVIEQSHLGLASPVSRFYADHHVLQMFVDSIDREATSNGAPVEGAFGLQPPAAAIMSTLQKYLSENKMLPAQGQRVGILVNSLSPLMAVIPAFDVFDPLTYNYKKGQNPGELIRRAITGATYPIIFVNDWQARNNAPYLLIAQSNMTNVIIYSLNAGLFNDLSNYQAEDGYGPFGYYAYAAVEIWAKAANETSSNGSLDFDRLSDFVSASRFDTVIGSVSFDETGNPADVVLEISRIGSGFSSAPALFIQPDWSVGTCPNGCPRVAGNCKPCK